MGIGLSLAFLAYLCRVKFADYRISEGLKNNIARLGFKRPTDIQYKSIPPILRRDDVLAIAQTGTGKTAAFAIPVIQRLLKERKNSDPSYVRCIVLVPTHELAQQISTVFESLSEGLGIRTLCLHGGVDQEPQIEALRKGIDIVVSTPGRLFDLRSQGELKPEQTSILVLDEADHMLDLGFIHDIKDLLRFIPKKRQTLFFSATINPRIKKLAYSIVQNPINIRISPKNPVSKNVTHSVIKIDMDDKRFFLERIVQEYPESKILCFVRTKVRAERVKKAMERVDIDAISMHGDKTEAERKNSMEMFRKAECRLLIATDISARGVDIPNVDIVVNYDLPELPDNYVHRIGRTGRGNLKGAAISFCSPEEESVLEEIEAALGRPIDVQQIDRSTYSETIDFSKEVSNDWKSLMENEDQVVPKKKKKKRKG